MRRPNFSADLIATLRHRVVAHNQQHPEAVAKLGALKDQYKRGFSGPQPDAAALAKVDAYLAGLAKAGESFDDSQHPRDANGKFARGGGSAPSAPLPQIVLPLPRTRAEHKALIDDNAGYAAFQTEVLPENRYASYGSALRSALSVGAGAAIAASLARGSENGMARRGSRFMGERVGRLLGAMTGGAAAGVSITAANEFRRFRGQPNTPAMDEAAKAAWMPLRQRYADAGGKMGRGAGDRVARVIAAPIKFMADAGESAGETPRRAQAYRYAAILASSAPIAAAVNQRIKNSPFDPERLGEAYDMTTYRAVQKSFAPTRRVNLHKAAGAQPLRKAIPIEQLWSRAGRTVLTGAAGAAGAVAGGALGGAGYHAAVHIAAHGKRGNPYHDEHGRFTSHTGAAVGTGAALGATAAALATYAALRGHNIGLQRAELASVKSTVRAAMDRIYSPAGEGEVAPLIADRAPLVNVRVSEHPKVVRAVKAGEKQVADAKKMIQLYGANAPLHYRQAVKDSVNTKIADMASSWDAFQVLDGKTWQTVGGIRKKLSHSMRDFGARDKIRAFLNTATPDEFKTAISGLTDQQKTTAQHWFDRRQAFVDGVDAQLAAHHERIDAARKASAEAEEAAINAKADLEAARAVDGRPFDVPEEAAAAKSALAQAARAETAARAAATKAEKKFTDLSTGDPKVVSPVDGKPLPAASSTDQAEAIARVQDMADAHVDKVRASVKKEAEAAHDKAIADLRATQARTATDIANREAAAIAVIGAKYGAPGAARKSGAIVGRYHRLIDRLDNKVVELRRQLAPVQTALEALGERPSALGRERQAYTKAHAAHTAEVKRLEGEIEGVQRQIRRAHIRLAAALPRYEQDLISSQKGRLKLLPDEVRAELERDVGRARAGVQDWVDAFLKRPTVDKLVRFGANVAEGTKSAASGAITDLFYRTDANGQPQLSTAKIIRNIGLLGGVAEAGHQAYKYLHGQVFGAPDGEPAPKFPAHILSQEVNPITGAGYVALTVAHPTDKGERVVLWGQRSDTLDAPPKQLVTGGRLAQVKSAFKDGKWDQGGQGGQGGQGQRHTGDAHQIPDDAKKAIDQMVNTLRNKPDSMMARGDTGPDGPTFSYRKKTDQEGNNAADQFLGYFKKQYLDRDNGKGELDPRTAWHALQALFSKQGAILSARQAYQVLTNYRLNGEKHSYKTGIFKGEGFGGTDAGKITAALRSEVERLLGSNPTDDQKANLRRAVGIIGIARALDSSDLKEIQQSIVDHKGQGVPRPAHQASAPQAEQASAPQAERPILKGESVHLDLPDGWNAASLAQLTRGDAATLARQAALRVPGDGVALTHLLHVFATHVGHTHGLSLPDSVKTASNTVYQLMGTTAESRRNFADELRAGNLDAGDHVIDALNLQAQKFVKSWDGDGLEILAKAYGMFDASKHPRAPKGAAGGGEFASDGGAGAAAPEGAAPSAPGMAGRPPRRARVSPDSEPVAGPFSPINVVPDLAAGAGMQVAWQAIDHHMPGMKAASGAVSRALQGRNPAGDALSEAASKGAVALRAALAEDTVKATSASIAQRVLPRVAGVFGGTVKAATMLVGAGLASAGADAAAEAATRGVYSAVGAKAGARAEENPDQSLARTGTTLAGSMIGSTVAPHIAARLAETGFARAAAGAVARTAVGTVVRATAGRLAATAIGGLIGRVAGGVAGGGVGSLATSVVGGYVGEKMAGAAYDHFFAGYDAPTAQRAKNRFMKPVAAQ